MRILLVLLAACGTGDHGGRAAATTPAHRIVSLSPAVTELLFAIGAGDRLVGRTTWCDYPPEARHVPSVGDGLNPNLEAVIAARPDLVVLYRSALNESAAARLQGMGIRAMVLPQDRLDELAAAARLLGRLTDREQAGDSVADAIARVRGAAAPDLGMRIAIIAWDNPPMVIGGRSYLDELATLAGARNVFHDLGSADVVSVETIVARDPDVLVVLSDSTSTRGPDLAGRRSWQAVRAVRERRIATLNWSLFGRPSPRVGQAVATFRRVLEATR